MTKHRGRDHLQYGAPGTEFNAYANGTYVGDAPLGPFAHAPYDPPPPTPAGVAARRQADARNATVSWTPVPNAVGDDVLRGIRPDRLHQTDQRFADEGTTLDVRALTVGRGDWFAFDERSVSPPSAPVAVP